MPGRKKRSELKGGGQKTPATTRQTKSHGVRELRRAVCPVCGTSHNLPHYAKTLDFDPAKPFGIIQDVMGGRGHGFTVLGHFGPADEPELFALVHDRLLAAVREYRAKGWVTQEEVEALAGPVAPVTPRPRPPAPEPEEEMATDAAGIVEQIESHLGKTRDLRDNFVASLEALMDEENKAGSIKKLTRTLDALDDSRFSGLDDVRDLVAEYSGIERAGMTPEEYNDAKAEAFETITEALQEIQIIPEEE